MIAVLKGNAPGFDMSVKIAWFASSSIISNPITLAENLRIVFLSLTVSLGVPITFMDKYNPDQFEIIGVGIAKLGLEIGISPYKPEHKKYRKEVQKRGAVDGDLYMIKNGEVYVPYSRIIVRNKRLWILN